MATHVQMNNNHCFTMMLEKMVSQRQKAHRTTILLFSSVATCTPMPTGSSSSLSLTSRSGTMPRCRRTWTSLVAPVGCLIVSVTMVFSFPMMDSRTPTSLSGLAMASVMRRTSLPSTGDARGMSIHNHTKEQRLRQGVIPAMRESPFASKEENAAGHPRATSSTTTPPSSFRPSTTPIPTRSATVDSVMAQRKHQELGDFSSGCVQRGGRKDWRGWRLALFQTQGFKTQVQTRLVCLSGFHSCLY